MPESLPAWRLRSAVKAQKIFSLSNVIRPYPICLIEGLQNTKIPLHVRLELMHIIDKRIPSRTNQPNKSLARRLWSCAHFSRITAPRGWNTAYRDILGITWPPELLKNIGQASITQPRFNLLILNSKLPCSLCFAKAFSPMRKNWSRLYNLILKYWLPLNL